MSLTKEMRGLLREASKQSAEDAYKEAQAKAEKLLKEIPSLLAAHAKKQAKSPKDWGYTGDINEVVSRLQSTRDFLVGEEK